MHKNILASGIAILLIVTVVTPMALGLDVETSEEQPDSERYLYPEYYDCYSTDEIDGYVEHQDTDVSSDFEPVEPTEPLDGPPMDSPWPMYCLDIHHTGRSPYSTIDTWDEKWVKKFSWDIEGSGVIDKDGVIYFGSVNNNFYAYYPNGTRKWYIDIKGDIQSSPAIDEDGIIRDMKIGTFSNKAEIDWRLVNTIMKDES